MSKIRRYFITGLLIILPVYITFYLLFIIFKLIDGFWGKLINLYLKKHFGFIIPGIGFIISVTAILAIGFIAAHFFGKGFFRTIERWFLKFPFIRQIYPSAKQIVNFFASKDRPSFKKVVLVEYPSKGIWSVGFVTNEGLMEAEEKTGEELIHVFIASTPSPFSGYLVLIPKDEVKFLDISIEEGIKLIVSGGILKP